MGLLQSDEKHIRLATAHDLGYHRQHEELGELDRGCQLRNNELWPE